MQLIHLKDDSWLVLTMISKFYTPYEFPYISYLQGTIFKQKIAK